MTNESEDKASPIKDQIDRVTGITKSPEQDAMRSGYTLQEAVDAVDAAGNVVRLPAGSQVRRM